ncbi:MAG: hypothetical protein JST79_22255 [Acidobacteria bacterium]|nr:hypothetical protein [Acidobacteriota bacterium]
MPTSKRQPLVPAEQPQIPPPSFDWKDASAKSDPVELSRAGMAIAWKDHKQLEQRLAHAHRMQSLGRLAGGAAHDFNNLLTVVSGHAHMLRESMLTPEEISESIAQIVLASEKAGALTRQLLRLSRNSTNQITVLHLKDVVSDARLMVQWMAGRKIRIEESLDPGTCPVRMDLAQFHQVLLDLAANACDAMPEGGTLTLRTWGHQQEDRGVSPWFEVLPGEYAVLEVGDTGGGVRPEIMAHLFEPFVSSKPAGSGTGLGLSTLHGIVRDAGGFVRVHSRLGIGARFQVFFPRAQTASRAAV